MCGLILQMITMARAKLIHSQELEASSEFPTRLQECKNSTAFLGFRLGTRWKVEKLGQKLVPVWDAGSSKQSISLHCAVSHACHF